MVALRAWGCSFLALFAVAAVAGGNARGDSAPHAPAARVASPTGLLAVYCKGATGWQILGQGESVPAECEVRAAAGQPCVVELDGARLYVAPEAQLWFPAGGRSFALHWGRICLKTSRDASWRVRKAKPSYATISSVASSAVIT